MVRAFGYNENGGPEVQEFLDVPIPSPLPGELLVQVHAAGVNPLDWKLRSGVYGAAQPSDLPAVMGAEVAGVIREVGQDVEGFSVGDQVFGSVAPGSGGYAEYALVTATNAAPKPPQVSFTDAATLTVAVGTAYDGVTQLELESGQTLLVNGVSGGVGVAAAQVARDLGLNVIGIAGEDKRALVESLGAILIPYGDGVADRVREVMPDGVDAILDLAGGDALRAVIDLLANRSKLISAADPVTAAELGGSGVVRDRSRGRLEIVAGLVAGGKLDPKVQDILPLDSAADAVAAVEVGRAQGKVVLEVS